MSAANFLPAPVQTVPWEHFAAWVGRVEKLEKDFSQLQASLPEWVDSKEAARLTGKCPTTLKRERKRPGTLLIAKQDGKKPLYLRASLLRYNDALLVRPRREGRDLAALLG